MKIHRVLAEAAYSQIDAVFSAGKVLDRQLASAFAANPKWGKRDRAWIAETVFEVVRWRRALSFVAASESTHVLCAAQWLRMGLDLPDWLGISSGQARDMADREAALPQQARAVRESIPDWLDARGETELGAQWAIELSALNRRAPVFLRVNTLKTTREEAQAWLISQGVACTTVDHVAEALVVTSGRTVPKSLLCDGRIEIQDAGSQLIVPMLTPQRGETIIDACAGAGGKSLQIAAHIHNQGTLIALDVASTKLETLRQRAKRANATCLQTRCIQEGTASSLHGTADRVLIDAPCSGLGTLRRQPDLKWRLTPQSLTKTSHLQRRLLRQYAEMAKRGGTVVYATCSILPTENQEAVMNLLNQGNIRLLHELTVSPASTGFDGFYAATLTTE